MNDVLVIVPAKRNSGRLENKNFLKLGDKTLFQLAIDRALESELGNILVISDDLMLQNHEGVSYFYHEPIESTHVRLPFAICEAIGNQNDIYFRKNYKTMVVTLPTSPFAIASDLVCAHMMYRFSGRTVMGVGPVDENLFLVMTIDGDFELWPYVNPLELDWWQRVKRDKFRKVRSNGAVYVSSIERFLLEREWYTGNMLGYQMPAERSLDVDTWDDYQVALARYKEKA